MKSNAITRYLILLMIVLGSIFFHADSYAFNTMSVTVTINYVKNRGHCWDGWPFCSRPDYFVTVYGTGTDQQSPSCQTSVVRNRDNVVPAPADWTCTFDVDRPGKIFIAVFDGDGPNDDATKAEQADVDPGPEKATAVGLEYIATGVPVSYTRVGDDTEVSFTVSATVNPGTLNSIFPSSTSFRPSAGEQITLSVITTGAPFLRFNALNSNGTNFWHATAYVPDPERTTTQMVWQGRDDFGNPLPPGRYQLVVIGSDPHSNSANLRTVPSDLSTAVTIQEPPLVASLNVLSVSPSPKWAPETGALSISVASSAAASISGKVFQWGTCTGAAIGIVNPITVQPALASQLTWDGTLFGNARVPVGQYSILVSGIANGISTVPASICKPIEVISAPKALLYMRHAPFLPEPGQTVELTAVSVDPTGAPRIVNRLDVWGMVYALGTTPPPPPIAPLRSCFRVSTCTAIIALPLTSAHLSWKTDAADADGVVMSTSGWRGQRVTLGTIFNQMTDFAFPTDVALNGPTAVQSRDLAYSYDLVFSVSTDFDWTSRLDRQSIGEALDRFMTRLWGLSGPGSPAPSTFLSRADLVRLYLVPERRVVQWSPPDNLCQWSVPEVDWADAIGILHKNNCRDNAFPYIRAFSAKLHSENVIFHELHHALFGLADEYCCDGGYSEDAPFPNVFEDLTRCSAVQGRETGGCGSIVEVDSTTRRPTGRVFYRLDADLPDVMDNNGPQRFGDVRKANWKERECDSGRC